ncbi:MAG TPA: hypothetical protein VKJ65_10170 [Phycisphaerae bacterium]|nr:hypothetical protein [Phycisphaerae bacterium]
MQALLEAVVSRIGSDAPMTQLVGAGSAPVYLTEAPETAPLPVIVIKSASGQIEHDFWANSISRIDLEMSITAAGLPAILSMADRLHALFDGTTFSLQAGVLLECRQISEPAPELAGFNSGDVEAYRVPIKFTCTVFNPGS